MAYSAETRKMTVAVLKAINLRLPDPIKPGPLLLKLHSFLKALTLTLMICPGTLVKPLRT